MAGAPGRIKVLYVITTLETGGAERQLAALVQRLDPSRFEAHVCSLSTGGTLQEALRRAGIPVRAIEFRALRDGRGGPVGIGLRLLGRLLALLAFIRRERPHIVHGILFWGYLLGTYAARLARVPVVIASRRSLGHFKAAKRRYLSLERFANRMTDLLIANSEAVKADVLSQEGVEASRVRVIPNGIDAEAYGSPPDPALRAALGLPGAARLVGVVANLLPYKGHRVFLEACREIKRGEPAARFLLIGEGPLRAGLVAYARELGLEEDVGFLGSRQDIPRLLALLEVAVLPSLEEGLPNAVLEAMAAGRPVVATAVGGTPEAVRHGETGLLVPPGESRALADAVLRLLQDPAGARRMGEEGRRWVAERFGIAAMVREYEAVYEGLVAARCPNQVRPLLPAGRTGA